MATGQFEWPLDMVGHGPQEDFAPVQSGFPRDTQDPQGALADTLQVPRGWLALLLMALR